MSWPLPKPPRRCDIDALRVLAVLLLLFFHAAMVFNEWPFHIKNARQSGVLTEFTAVLNVWHMPLFFLLAGASTWMALDFRSGGAYAAERIRRLLVPLVVGCLVIVPPQVYVERISPWSPMRWSPIDFEGSYLAFYPHFFQGIYPDGNFSWHHLWFVAYLLVYSLVTLPLVLFLKRSERGRRLAARLAGFLARPGMIFLLAAPLVLVELALRGCFPSTHALVDDWANHAHFVLVFLYGCLLIGDDRLAQALVRHRAAALPAALGLTTALLVGRRYVTTPSTAIEIAGTVLWCGGQWCWLIAITGYGRTCLDRPSRTLRHAAEIAYPFYIWHQTVIVVIAYYVVRWNAGIATKFAVVSAAALVITTLLCELVRSNNLTRFLFGMPPRRPVRRT